MIRKSSADTNSYKSVTLENGIEVLLISNPAFTKASCAISVNVGSFDNPEAFPGLAHFLEHMLLMGTEAYPGESDFRNFVSLHNGYANAGTSKEATVYYCDVDASALETLADMLSAFFINPLFIRGTVERELSAVNSEYLYKLNNHARRVYTLLGEFTRKGDMRGKFSCGNSETLRHDKIWERVVQFWKDTYSSDLMKLVMSSSHSFDEMEKFLVCFSKIKRNGQISKKGKFSRELAQGSEGSFDFCFFDDQYLQKIVQVAPLDDLKELSIFINLPPAFHLFRKNPYSLIKFLFTSTEPDGLLARLKNEGLAFALSMSYGYFGESTRVDITARLTNKGCEAYRRVLDLISAYLRCMRVDERDFARLKRLQEEKFRISQPKKQLELAMESARDMLVFPVEHVMDHEYVYESFDPELIGSIVKMIGDYSRWIVVFSDNRGEFDRKEKYYGTEYRVVGEYAGAKEDGGALDKAGSDASLDRSCGLIDEDKWHADRYLDSMDLVRLGGRFVKIERFENGSVSHVFDEEFGVPKSKVFILLRSDEAKSVYVPLELYLSLAEDAFAEEHARQLCNYHLDMKASLIPDGVVIQFEGVSGRVSEMCRRFFSGLSRIRSERFELFRKRAEDAYMKKMTEAPIGRLGEVFRAAKTGMPSAEDCLSVLDTITLDDITFLGEYRTEVVAVGNIQYSDVLEIYEAAGGKKTDNNKTDSDAVADETSVVEKGFKTTDKFNNALGMFYETVDFGRYCDNVEEGARVLREAAVGRLLHQIGFEDFFRQLRTTEELGYCVASRMHVVKKREYIAFVVQSQKPVEFLETRIRKFVQDLLERIRTMDEEALETHKESLISSYEEPILNIDTLWSFVWNQHLNAVVDLDFNKKMVAAVRKLGKADLLGSGVLERYNKVYSYAE